MKNVLLTASNRLQWRWVKM